MQYFTIQVLTRRLYTPSYTGSVLSCQTKFLNSDICSICNSNTLFVTNLNTKTRHRQSETLQHNVKYRGDANNYMYIIERLTIVVGDHQRYVVRTCKTYSLCIDFFCLKRLSFAGTRLSPNSSSSAVRHSQCKYELQRQNYQLRSTCQTTRDMCKI